VIRVALTRLALIAACITVAMVPLAAHPLATTTVSLTLQRDGVIDVTIAAEADPLIAKLEALSGVESSPTSMTRAARLELLATTLLDHIDLRADGVRRSLTVRDVIVDPTAQATIRMAANVPSGAQHVTWRSTFIFGSYPIAVRAEDGPEAVEWLQGPQTSAPIALSRTRTSLGLIRAVAMGFTHIVPAGLDHILFVLGLFLLSRRTREVLMQVTAFTLAHSVTLGLSLYGLVSAPASLVEPMIALSVAYVGIENLMTSRLQPWRVAVVFAFGLLHGMGFAEALSGLHLSSSSLAVTLVSFNVGVEAGQLTVIGVAAVALALITHTREGAGAPIVRFASAAIGVAGIAWTLQRLGG